MLRTLPALLAALLLLPTAVAAGEALDEDRVDLTAPAEDVDTQRAIWRDRFETARGAVAEARERHSQAQRAYGDMRHRRRERGAEKAQILSELTSSEMALATAEGALKDLFESARKAGVPPGWMRMSQADSPAASTP